MKVMLARQLTTENEDGSSQESIVVVFSNDKNERQTVMVTSDNPGYAAAADALQKFSMGDITASAFAAELTEATEGNKRLAEEKFERVTDFMGGRITLVNGRVLIDGDHIDTAVEQHLLRLLSATRSASTAEQTKVADLAWLSFGKFIENLYSNVNEHVRSQLFRWMTQEANRSGGFTLTDDGCFIGYKGCAGSADSAVSINHGTAIVNGVAHEGAIPNPLGAVVEMSRSNVNDDPAQGCSYGLHVGTYDYAKGWAQGVLLTVKVNPRDVVSVPTECDSQKIRTCRYEVLENVEVAYTAPVWVSDDYDWDDDDECEDGYCDCGCCDEPEYECDCSCECYSDPDCDNEHDVCEECKEDDSASESDDESYCCSRCDGRSNAPYNATQDDVEDEESLPEDKGREEAEKLREKAYEAADAISKVIYDVTGRPVDLRDYMEKLEDLPSYLEEMLPPDEKRR